MKSLRACLLATLIGLTLPLLAQEATSQPAASQPAAAVPEAKTEVQTLIISKGLDSNLMRAAYGSFSSDAIKPGTLIVARTTLQEGSLASIESLPRITTFADDQKTDFGQGKADKSRSPDNDSQCFLSSDARTITFFAVSPTLPASNASQIQLTGLLAARLGVGEKVASLKDQPLKLGHKFTAHDLTFIIDSIGETEREGRGLYVTLSTTSFESVKKIEFFDAQDNPIAATPPQRQYRDRPNSQQMTIMLSKSVRSATIKVTLFEKVESIKIPFDLKIKVGL